MLLKTNVCIILIIILLLTACSTSPGLTPLQNASGQLGPNPNILKHFPNKKNTDIKVVKKLIDEGVDINESNYYFGTALHFAARSGDIEIIKYLTSHGANINARTFDGITPLMAAAQNGRLDAVKLFLSKGANLNETSTRNNYSSLTEAAYSGNFELVSYLISIGANVKRDSGYAYVRAAEGMGEYLSYINTKNPNFEIQEKSVIEKVKFEYIAILDLLASKSADINTFDWLGKNALHQAASTGSPDVVRYFLKSGIDPSSSKNSIVGTPLKEAKFKEGIYRKLINDSYSSKLKPIYESRLSGYEQIIDILTPLTKVVEPAKVNAVIANDTFSLISPNSGIKTKYTDNTEAANSGVTSVTDQVVSTIAECAKLKLSLNACDRLPWPLSSGCSSLAKAQFSNGICKG